MKRVLWILMAAWLFSCDTAEQSDIPYSNVYFKIDLRFQDKELNALLANKTFMTPRYAGEAMGYSGILVVHGLNDVFYAYELCCPYEARREIRIEVDSTGLYGICPQCQSKYDIVNGGYPVEGPARNYLRTCNVHANGSELVVEGYSN
ncbi:MAG: hypothetical protein ACI30I_01860 [Parabacteroides sp.]